jgi:hypothetical protein
VTGLPVIEVYCQGPHDHPHDQIRVAAYRPVHATPTTPTAAVWSPLSSWRGV